MHKLFSENQKALISLPPRNDTEAEVSLQLEFPEGVLNFEGQDFVLPGGFQAGVLVKWLEENLLLAEIKIGAEISAECARCLKPVNLEISGNLMYLYYLRGAEAEDEFNESDEFGDYMPVEIDSFGRVIDVMPQIQESIYTLLPTKVLCKEDCKGLCPSCGADLNEGQCSCKDEFFDSRLEALRNFRFE